MMPSLTHNKKTVGFVLFALLLIGVALWSISKTPYQLFPEIPQQPLIEAESEQEAAVANQLVTDYTFTAAEPMTAEELLNQNATVEYQDFGSAGKFVQSINGLASNSENFWGYYVNGEFAQAGVSQTQLQAGDTIRFTYEKIESTQQ